MRARPGHVTPARAAGSTRPCLPDVLLSPPADVGARRGGNMACLRMGARLLAVALAAPIGAGAARAADPPSPAPAGAPHKSVYGKLTRVDDVRNGVIMKTDAGENMAWRFHPRVIAEAKKFKEGDPMIVIYRQIASNEKRVTALAFPGSASSPIYVNTTGSRVLVRSSAMSNGVCGQPDAGPISDVTIPAAGVSEVLEACWCCAASGESCTPGNKSGNGRALLVACFK